MHPSVRSVWRAFTVDIEGEVPFMYLDIKGLVTVGIGNLIDPVAMAEALPFQLKATNNLGLPGGQPATHAQINAEWTALKHNVNRSHLMMGGYRLCAPLTNLELNPVELLALFNAKTNSNERTLRKAFTNYDKWPAEAQLGVMSMAWALGPAFTGTWRKFTAACLKEDFDTAATECVMRGGGGIARRNRANVKLFNNAARVVRNPRTYQRSTLYYPTVLWDEIVISA